MRINWTQRRIYLPRARRSFVLLEVVIGIALVSMMTFWLIKSPLTSLKKEAKELIAMEEARLFAGKLLELKPQLHKLAPTLPLSEKEGLTHKVTLPLHLGRITTLEKSYTLWQDPPFENKGHKHHLVFLQTSKESKYKFYVTLQPSSD